MSEEKTIFVGGGKTANEDKTWIKATLNLAKFKEHVQEYKGTKFLKLNINIRDEADQYGKNVSISIDTWTPPEEPTGKEVQETTPEDDLPF